MSAYNYMYICIPLMWRCKFSMSLMLTFMSLAKFTMLTVLLSLLVKSRSNSFSSISLINQDFWVNGWRCFIGVFNPPAQIQINMYNWKHKENDSHSKVHVNSACKKSSFMSLLRKKQHVHTCRWRHIAGMQFIIINQIIFRLLNIRLVDIIISA